MNILSKATLLIVIIALILITFTSFSQIRVEVYYPHLEDSQSLEPLERVEYEPYTEKKIEAPYINQVEKYPNGCEAVSTVMALSYLGIGISPEVFIDEYLEKGDIPKPGKSGPDPDRVYCGDPYLDSGWGCNAPCIVSALNKFIDPSQYSVTMSYGTTLWDLCCDYIDRDIPVVVWVTVDMQDASAEEDIHRWTTEEGKEVSYNRKQHCMLLCGYDEDNYYFNDPLAEALKAYPKAETEKAYAVLGMQSVVITRNSELKGENG